MSFRALPPPDSAGERRDPAGSPGITSEPAPGGSGGGAPRVSESVMNLRDWKVRELVERFPETKEVLDAHGVDLCCGGEHTLEQTARAKGADVEAVVRAVEAKLPSIDLKTPLPEILARFPGTRDVFDRYGLHGCGGMAGPAETVEFFAAFHGVEPAKLLGELHEAAAKPAPAPACPTTQHGRFIPLLRTALAALLTGGATFGAVMLLLYGLQGDFLSVSLFPWIQAHGFSMVYGFVLLFVMGFAVEVLPRFRMRAPPGPSLGRMLLALVAAAVVLRFATAAMEPAWSAVPTALVLVAALLFAGFVVRSVWPVRGPSDVLQLAGTAFLLAAVAGEAALAVALSAAKTEEQFTSRVATYLTAVRDAQFLGFATCWIFSVGLRVWPNAFGCRAAGTGKALAASALLIVGAAGAIGSWLAYRLAGAPAPLVWAFQILFAAGAAWLVFSMGLLRPRPEGGRSGKFLAASSAWLLVALAMLLAMPAYIVARGEFSHAYFGAVRHAFTVGFLTMMIVAVSSRVIPVWTGRPGRSQLWVPFVLLNLGNALRVTSEVATDWFGEAAFLVMPFSAMLEVTALVLWAWEVWPRSEVDAPTDPAAQRKVAEVLAESPEALDVLVRHGFGALANPFLRKLMAGRVTLAQACRMHGVAWEPLKRDLEALRAPVAKVPFEV